MNSETKGSGLNAPFGARRFLTKFYNSAIIDGRIVS